MNVCGTPWIMAPELLKNEAYGSPADVFSFGIVLCEIVMRCPAEDIPRSNDFGVDIKAVKKATTNFPDDIYDIIYKVL